MNEKELEKIEQGIADSIKKEVANLDYKEKEKRIEIEIRKRNYLSEDWQIHYAVDRIKEMANQSDVADVIVSKPRKSKLLMAILTFFVMVISFFVMLASVNIVNPVLKGGLIMASFASFVYPIKMWWKSFTSKG